MKQEIISVINGYTHIEFFILMKKINFTKKHVVFMIISSIILLFIDLIGYYYLYLKSSSSTWGGIVFCLVMIIIVFLSAIPYFPTSPKSLRKWLYFISIALILSGTVELSYKLNINPIVTFLLNAGATIFYLSSLLISIRAYREITN